MSLTIRQAPFALRVVQRKEGTAAIVYRLQRVGGLSALAYTAALPLLRDAVAKAQNGDKSNGRARTLTAGKFHPLNQEWGARVALYCLAAAGLRDAERLVLAAGNLRNAHPDEAAWWLGQLTRDDHVRALRALRILIEAVE